MRNLRKIFESLGFLDSTGERLKDLVLFNRIIDAVVVIAEGDEAKAASASATGG